MIIEKIMSTNPLLAVMRVEFEIISSSSPVRDADILLQQKHIRCLLVVADNRLIGIVLPHNLRCVTVDLLQDREELKFDGLDEGADIEVLDENDLSDIFVEKSETEDWNQIDV